MSSFRSRDMVKTGFLALERLLDLPDFRRVFLGFELLRALRFVERVLLVRREVLFLVTNDPPRAQ